MKNELKFNSQVCTTKEQSQILSDLGLERETADMYYSTNPQLLFIRDKGIPLEDEDFPAWSLHRLIEMMPTIITNDDYFLLLGINTTCVYYTDDKYTKTFKNFEGDLYDCVVKCIEWLIKEGHFNKEYLKQ